MKLNTVQSIGWGEIWGSSEELWPRAWDEYNKIPAPECRQLSDVQTLFLSFSSRMQWLYGVFIPVFWLFTVGAVNVPRESQYEGRLQKSRLTAAAPGLRKSRSTMHLTATQANQ